MSEKIKKVITNVILLIIFAISLTLTVIGQRNIGAAGLGIQLLGVAGMIFLLWNYNRKYK